ncbi:hypothetical protein BC628DRAFT_143791 [Trametes gibbosa]|nr:hypothetical protein BC628DRAFT_143791 [Trametes gibbosa]
MATRRPTFREPPGADLSVRAILRRCHRLRCGSTRTSAPSTTTTTTTTTTTMRTATTLLRERPHREKGHVNLSPGRERTSRGSGIPPLAGADRAAPRPTRTRTRTKERACHGVSSAAHACAPYVCCHRGGSIAHARTHARTHSPHERHCARPPVTGQLARDRMERAPYRLRSPLARPECSGWTWTWSSSSSSYTACPRPQTAPLDACPGIAVHGSGAGRPIAALTPPSPPIPSSASSTGSTGPPRSRGERPSPGS